jgi:hypothetical protein
MPGNESLVIAAPLLIAAIVMAFRFVGCGIDADPIPGPWNDDGDGEGGKPQAVAANFTGHGALTATVGFPGNDPKQTPFTEPGTVDYPIPYWCDTIDLILLGAGGGGLYSDFNVRSGGGAGSWRVVTVQRGSDIPWATTTITVTVGQGGVGGSGSAPDAAPGGDTSASWDTSSGMTTTETASGGAAAAAPDSTGAASNPSSESVGNAKLDAGAPQPDGGADGNAPGGGGAGGGGLKQGGDGANGAALVVARQT